MTWSVVARCPATGAFGVAVATRAFAVGARCPFVRAGVGAVATQASVNTGLGPRVLDALAGGADARAAVEGALAPDEGRGIRQLHAVDAQGRVHAVTGRHCVASAGHVAGEGVSVAGNMLSNDGVIRAALAAFEAGGALPFPERLLAAMDAGEAAGGDRRGRQSAALLVANTEDFPDIDLRVDDHAEPLPELRRLLGAYRQHLEPVRHLFPTRAEPHGVHDLDAIEAQWAARGLDLKFTR